MWTFLLIGMAFSFAILGCVEVGWRIRNAHRHDEAPDIDAGLNALAGAVFGLMGLLIAFTFTSAAARFETRRELITTETNAIGTAWLRVDMLPAAAQPAIRQDFRDYLDDRIQFHRLLRDNIPEARIVFARGNQLQAKIWKEAVAACQAQNSPAVTSLMTSSLNEMIDITTTRYVALLTHPPLPVYMVLAFLVLASSLLAGYGMGKSGKRNWTHILVFSAALAVAMYVILDLDYPRGGLITVENFDLVMVDLRKSMD